MSDFQNGRLVRITGEARIQTQGIDEVARSMKRALPHGVHNSIGYIDNNEVWFEHVAPYHDNIDKAVGNQMQCCPEVTSIRNISIANYY